MKTPLRELMEPPGPMITVPVPLQPRLVASFTVPAEMTREQKTRFLTVVTAWLDLTEPRSSFAQALRRAVSEDGS